MILLVSQVTVMPRETGRLYFVGLSYTLNRVQCCQLLLRQSAHLHAFLTSKGFKGPQGGTLGGPSWGVFKGCNNGDPDCPPEGFDVRLKTATAAAAVEPGLPPAEFSEAAEELLQ